MACCHDISGDSLFTPSPTILLSIDRWAPARTAPHVLTCSLLLYTSCSRRIAIAPHPTSLVRSILTTAFLSRDICTCLSLQFMRSPIPHKLPCIYNSATSNLCNPRIRDDHCFKPIPGDDFKVCWWAFSISFCSVYAYTLTYRTHVVSCVRRVNQRGLLSKSIRLRNKNPSSRRGPVPRVAFR